MTVEMTFREIVQAAANFQASDIYLIPSATGYEVRCYTANGIQNLSSCTAEIGATLIRHIKYGAQMNLGEVRRPQLGRWTYMVDGCRLNLRISSVGDFLNRESVVIRLMYEQQYLQTRWQDEQAFATLCRDVTRRSGLILLAGQMGAGKTTTLYAAVAAGAGDKMVLTIEDPVEIVNPAFLQLQVNPLADMDYQSLLKLALRHHPDLMIIGEIRDAKTAQIVVEAALSGHLILSTVHARSIAGVRERLLNLGVTPQQLDAVLLGVGYQEMQHDEAGPIANLTYESEDDHGTNQVATTNAS